MKKTMILFVISIFLLTSCSSDTKKISGKWETNKRTSNENSNDAYSTLNIKNRDNTIIVERIIRVHREERSKIFSGTYENGVINLQGTEIIIFSDDLKSCQHYGDTYLKVE